MNVCVWGFCLDDRCKGWYRDASIFYSCLDYKCKGWWELRSGGLNRWPCGSPED